MKEMKGLGSLGNGGSSSSANLSASAPPFTVDRSNLKPISIQSLHFSDPPYATPSNETWLYPHSLAPKPNFSSNPDLEVDSTRTTYMPLADDYCYSGYESTNPTRTHWYTVSSGAKAAITANYYTEPKPYYHSYDDTPLVALNEPNYDSLSTTGLVPLDGSSQVDHTQSLSGLEYVPQWGGFWNRFTEGQQGKQIQVNVNFCAEEANVGGSFVYKKQGHTVDSMSKCEENSAISHGKSSEILGKEKCTGSLIPWQLDDKSFLTQSFSFVPFQSSRTPFCGTNSIHSPLETSLQSATNLLNHHKPYSPYDNCLQPLDSSANGFVSVTKSSPALVIRPPVTGTTACAPSTVSPKTLDIGNIAVFNIDDVDSHNLGKKKEVHLPHGSKSIEGCLDTARLSFHKEIINHNFASYSNEEELSNKQLTKDALNQTKGARSGFQVLDINVPDGFSLTIDSAEAVKSIENSSDSLDSPCWKGAPASHFSLEALTPQPLMKDLEACNGLNLHGTHIFPSFGDSIKASSQNLSENIQVHNENGRLNNNLPLSPKKTSDTNHPAKDHVPADIAIAGSGCPKLSGSKEVQFSNYLDKPSNEHELPNESDSVFKASHTQLSLEGDNFTYTRLKLHTDVCDMGVNTNDASKGGCVPFPALENILCSPSYGKDVTELVKQHGRESTPKMDVKMLLKTMRNLSELLLFHCSIDEFTLKEQDHEALKHAIGNLDACVSKKMVHRTPTQESMFPLPDTSYKFGELHDLRVGDSASRPQVTNVAADNFHVQFNCQNMHEERRNDNVSGKKVEKFPDFVSLKDDAYVLKHDNMVQDIKKVLDENFHSKEDMQPQTLFYKNLWLEAEAELCSLSYKTRFDRMKTEMEKSKAESDNSIENTMVAEKLPSSNNSPDPNITRILTDEAKDSPILKADVQDSPISSRSPVNDVEASVVARFHILKSRGDNSNPIKMEKHQVPEVDAGFDGSEEETVKELKEFGICITNDPVIQSHRSCWLQNQLPSGWYDSSSSDWEHVLKDEFSGPK